MKDALGRTIREGDYLIYPQRYSSSMWLTLGYVQSVREGRLTLDRVNLGDDASKLKRTFMTVTYRSIVVPSEAVPERYRAAIEGPLEWDGLSHDRIRRGKRREQPLPGPEEESLYAPEQSGQTSDTPGETTPGA